MFLGLQDFSIIESRTCFLQLNTYGISTLLLYILSKTLTNCFFQYFPEGGPLLVFFKLPVSEISEIDDHKSVRIDFTIKVLKFLLFIGIVKLNH